MLIQAFVILFIMVGHLDPNSNPWTLDRPSWQGRHTLLATFGQGRANIQAPWAGQPNKFMRESYQVSVPSPFKAKLIANSGRRSFPCLRCKTLPRRQPSFKFHLANILTGVCEKSRIGFRYMKAIIFILFCTRFTELDKFGENPSSMN